MSEKITSEEWIRAYEAAHKRSEDPADGVSTRHLAEILGVGQVTISRRLKKLVNAGLWEYRGKRLVKNMTGQDTWTPIYGPVKKGKTNDGRTAETGG